MRSGAFATYIRVRFHEVDSLGHVNNAAYLNYLEQAAIDHAAFLGLTMARSRELGGVFVAHRHEMLFLRPAVVGDLLRVVTWLGEARGARIERHYRIFRETAELQELPVAGRLLLAGEGGDDSEALVQATTEWVFASEVGQVRRIPKEIVELFSLPAAE